MITAYLDTSAAMKLLVDEAESEALVTELIDSSRRLVASWLVHTALHCTALHCTAALHCAAGRNPTFILLDAVTTVLDVVNPVEVTRGDLLAAGAHAPLRSSDAIHLATALRLGVDEVVTYDDELARAAVSAGIRVVAPAWRAGSVGRKERLRIRATIALLAKTVIRFHTKERPGSWSSERSLSHE